MKNDRQVNISAAGSRRAYKWPVLKLYWSEFVDKVKMPARSTETLAQYLAMTKAQQDDLKDVGGYVGGVVNGARKSGHIAGRDLVTLDMDNISSGSTENILHILASMGCGYCVYSTRKHEPIRPRLRAVFPLSRTCSEEEYEPIARKMAEIIGMEFMDPTTFQATRLMFWPSASADSEYVFRYEDKPFVDADGILGMYKDWKDITSWPRQPKEDAAAERMLKKQADPTEKSGIVGAFCKAYSIERAMDELIPDAYISTDVTGRYTYAEGTTSGGAIVYDDGRFIYSHHATDPCGGKLCNAFDMVRLHKFSEKDEEAAPNTPTSRMPSYLEMCSFAGRLPEVVSALDQERYQKAVEAFGEAQGQPVEVPDDTNTDWMQQLTRDKNGDPNKTIDNVRRIVEGDQLLKSSIQYNEFKSCIEATGKLPWNLCEDRREWTDDDDSGLRLYIELVYQITGKDRVNDGLVCAAREQSVNDVKQYIADLPEWDRVPRLDGLFIDYLGAKDSSYTRAAARKSFTAAIARVMEPGIKYDYMPILTGPQGIGKSTLFKTMGMGWYSDSIVTFEGKDAPESLQGNWIIEVAELSAMGRSRTEVMKQFISRQNDIYRKAYGRRTNRYPRQCVIFGTTNDREFLRDSTGNRRFWPIEVTGSGPKSVFDDLPEERDQIWAEALVRYKEGEALYLTGEDAALAMQAQEEHSESNAAKGIIIEFLLKRVPEGWMNTDMSTREMATVFKNAEEVRRDRICAAEIWVECYGFKIGRMTKIDSREINNVLESLQGLEKTATGRFGPYGRQRGFYIKEGFYLWYDHKKSEKLSTFSESCQLMEKNGLSALSTDKK